MGRGMKRARGTERERERERERETRQRQGLREPNSFRGTTVM